MGDLGLKRLEVAIVPDDNVGKPDFVGNGDLGSQEPIGDYGCQTPVLDKAATLDGSRCAHHQIQIPGYRKVDFIKQRHFDKGQTDVIRQRTQMRLHPPEDLRVKQRFYLLTKIGIFKQEFAKEIPVQFSGLEKIGKIQSGQDLLNLRDRFLLLMKVPDRSVAVEDRDPSRAGQLHQAPAEMALAAGCATGDSDGDHVERCVYQKKKTRPVRTAFFGDCFVIPVDPGSWRITSGKPGREQRLREW